MRNRLKQKVLLFFDNLQDLASSEAGQDLVEYALLVSLIALAAVGGIGKVATAVNSVFSRISSSLG